MTLIGPQPPATAPQDGRVIRGWFWNLNEAGADVHAVSWEAGRARWVNLLGEAVPDHLQLAGWASQ
jgi:hypothetical protein